MTETPAAEVARAATVGALRYAAEIAFYTDEDLAASFYATAKNVEREDLSDSPCCPVCEEVTCDEGCPLEPYRG